MKKLCGCKKNLIDITQERCAECEKIFKENENKRKWGKGCKNESFYHSKAWSNLSKLVRDRFNGLDLYQLKVNGVMVESKQVHHIIPINENPDLKFSLENLIPLSIETHMYIEKLYKTSKRKKIQKLLLELVKKGI